MHIWIVGCVKNQVNTTPMRVRAILFDLVVSSPPATSMVVW